MNKIKYHKKLILIIIFPNLKMLYELELVKENTCVFKLKIDGELVYEYNFGDKYFGGTITTMEREQLPENLKRDNIKIVCQDENRNVYIIFECLDETYVLHYNEETWVNVIIHNLTTKHSSKIRPNYKYKPMLEKIYLFNTKNFIILY